MKKVLSTLLVLSFSAMALVGCGGDTTSSSSEETSAAASTADTSVSATAADSVTITHQLGEITVAKNPEKVVVFDFGSLDTIDALGVTPELAVPKSNLPEYLKKYEGDEYTDVGGVKEFDLETVNAFEPDLIIIMGRQQDSYDDLSAIAPTLFMEIDSTQYMADFERNMGWMGEIFDKTDEVNTKMDEIKGKITQVQESVAANPEKTLVILTNDGSISAYGPGSRFGIIYDVFNVPAADDTIEVSTHGQEINYEYISKLNPEVILVVDRTVVVGGDTDGAKTLDNELVNGTTAAQNDQIHYLSPDIWYLSGGGLESVDLMCDEIVNVYAK